MNKARVNAAWFLLKYTYGIAAIVVGLDKIFPLINMNYFLTNWLQYVHPELLAMFSAMLNMVQFLYVVGLIEIVAGILVFLYPRIGGYVVAAWLVVIVINLAAMGMYFDIMARDLVMAAGAVALAWLSEAGCGCE